MSRAAVPILFNPSSGLGRAVHFKDKLEAELRRLGVPFALTVTESEAHLRELTRRKAADDRLVAGAGGDSTFMIMADEIMKTGGRAALGLIGLGSSNDVPAAFGLGTIETACRALRDGRRRKIDVGLILGNGNRTSYFLGQANIGLGAAVNVYMAGLAARHPRLASRQTIAGFFGVRQAYKRRSVPLQLRLEGRESGRVEGRFIVALFANTPFWATGKRIAPQAEPDDGLLDACLIGPCSMRRLARIAALARTGRHIGEPEVRILRSGEFVVRADAAFDVQADGEIVCGGEKREPAMVIIRAVPAALEIAVPA